MLEDQSNLILDNFKALVHETNLKKLIQKLIDKGVSSELVEKTPHYVQYDDIHNKRCFFFHLTKLDSSIFPKFVQALRDLDHIELANKLDRNSNRISHCEPFRLPSDYGSENGDAEEVQLPVVHYREVISDKEPLKINVRLSTQFYDTDEYNRMLGFYRTRSKNRGIVLTINNYEFCDGQRIRRLGAEVDDKNIQELFSTMGLKVISYRNKTAEEIRTIVTDFTKFNHTHIADVCFVIVMSHGGEIDNQTVIDGIDNFKVETSWIIEQFNNANCLYLLNKPKIFLFQTCRGILNDNYINRTQSDSSSISRRPRIYSDILVAYPSVRGYKAHRDIYRGSWFIDVMSEIFMEHSHNMHVESMLKKIDERFRNRVSSSEAQTMQTLHFENMGFKNCYLHPGIYEQNGEITYFNTNGVG